MKDMLTQVKPHPKKGERLQWLKRSKELFIHASSRCNSHHGRGLKRLEESSIYSTTYIDQDDERTIIDIGSKSHCYPAHHLLLLRDKDLSG